MRLVVFHFSKSSLKAKELYGAALCCAAIRRQAGAFAAKTPITCGYFSEYSIPTQPNAQRLV
jgi:hypothetical protein